MTDRFQNCLQAIIQKTARESEKDSARTVLFSEEGNYWSSRLRVEAVRRGLEYIYILSKDISVFNTFGNDIIQCFYDLSRV